MKFLAILLVATFAAASPAAEPETKKDAAKHVLEFRIAEDKPADGLIKAEFKIDGVATTLYLRPEIAVSEADVVAVTADTDDTGGPLVYFTLSKEGGKKMREFTKKNHLKRMAIIVAGKPITAPTIRSEIGEEGQITGNFTKEEVESMVAAIGKGLKKKKTDEK